MVSGLEYVPAVRRSDGVLVGGNQAKGTGSTQNMTELTNVAQTWGKVAPFTSGRVRVKGEQIWSSDFYALHGLATRSTQISNPADPFRDPFGANTTNEPIDTEGLFAIDIAYSFGIEAIPGVKRVLRRLRVDGTIVWDIDDPRGKFSFDMHFAEDRRQNPTMVADLGASQCPYFPDQTYCVIWGLVAPIPREIDAEFTMIVGDFKEDVLDGEVLPAIDGRHLPDYPNRTTYAYNFDNHTVTGYDMRTLEVTMPTIPCDPTVRGKKLDNNCFVWFQKMGVFAAIELDFENPFGAIHIYEVRTGKLVKAHGAGVVENQSGPFGPKGLRRIIYAAIRAKDTESDARIVGTYVAGSDFKPFYVNIFKRNEEITLEGDVFQSNDPSVTGPIDGYGHGSDGTCAYSSGPSLNFIIKDMVIVKCDPFPLQDGDGPVTNHYPIFYNNKIVWISQRALNHTDLNGKLLKTVPFGRTIGFSTAQAKDYPNVACGFIGLVLFGDLVLINLTNLEFKFYATKFQLFGANAWMCDIAFARAYQGGQTLQLNFPLPSLGGKILLREFIRACYVASGYFQPEDLIFDDIEDEIYGAQVIQVQDVSSVLADIKRLYRIEQQDLGGKLRFYRNKKSAGLNEIALTIEHTDLALIAEGDENFVNLKSFIDGADEDRPQIAVNFIDVNAEFATNQVAYKPPGSRANSAINLSIPLVLDRTTALQLLTKLYIDVLSGQTKYEFRLPSRYIFISSGDIIVIRKGDFNFTMRILEDNLNADWSVSCVAENVTLSIEPRISDALVPDRSPVAVSPENEGPSLPIIIDSSSLYDSDNAEDNDKFIFQFVLYSTSPKWKVGYLARKQDGGDWQNLGQVSATNKPSVANTGNALVECGHIFDYTPLQIEFVNAKWDASNNKTKEELFADGKLNNAYYGAPGRWEIVRFLKIVDNKVIGILRGCRGTEVFTHTHAVGDKFILANGAITKSRLDYTDPLEVGTYRGGATGVPFDAQSDFAYQPLAHSLKPWSPYLLKGVRSGSDVRLSWDRRDRRGSGWGSTDAPISDALAFELDVYVGNAVVRTLATNGQQVVYTQAQMNADGTAGLDVLSIAAYQVSDAVGRGFGKRINVNVR